MPYYLCECKSQGQTARKHLLPSCGSRGLKQAADTPGPWAAAGGGMPGLPRQHGPPHPSCCPAHPQQEIHSTKGSGARKGSDRRFAAAAWSAIVFGMWFSAPRPKSGFPTNSHLDLSALLPVVSRAVLWTSQSLCRVRGRMGDVNTGLGHGSRVELSHWLKPVVAPPVGQ